MQLTPAKWTRACQAEFEPIARAAWQQHAPESIREYVSLFLALIETESSWIPSAQNAKTGALGLGQLMPATAGDLGLHEYRDIIDPYKNLDASVRYIAQNYRFGQQSRRLKNPTTPLDACLIAMAAYNCGPGHIYLKRIRSGAPLSVCGRLAQRFLPMTIDHVLSVLPEVTGAASSETISYITKIRARSESY